MSEPDDLLPPPLLESYGGEGSGFLRFELFAMGTQNVFLVRGPSDDDVRLAAHEAFQTFDRLEERLSKFLPESDVSLINSLAASAPVHVGPDLFDLLVKAKEAWSYTSGVFDPTVGPLLEAWGFVDGDGRVPDDAYIDERLKLRGMDLVHLNQPTREVRFERPGVSVDLGAIGKGYAADRLVEQFQQQGATAGALVCGRSTVATWGTPPGEAAWRFEVVDPMAPQEFLLSLRVEPGALSSSGAYERYFHTDDGVYGHILDPRTGRPAAGAVKGATVWTRSALLGDVLSTTLFLLGREALQPGGAVERLSAAWEGDEARVGCLLLESDEAADRGVHATTHFIGEPPFVVTQDEAT